MLWSGRALEEVADKLYHERTNKNANPVRINTSGHAYHTAALAEPMADAITAFLSGEASRSEYQHDSFDGVEPYMREGFADPSALAAHHEPDDMPKATLPLADPGEPGDKPKATMLFDGYAWKYPAKPGNNKKAWAQTYQENVPWTSSLQGPRGFVPRNYSERPAMCSYAEHFSVGQETVYFYNFSPFSTKEVGDTRVATWHKQYRDMTKKCVWDPGCMRGQHPLEEYAGRGQYRSGAATQRTSG